MVRCGLTQASCEWSPEEHSLDEIKKRMVAKHERLIEAAGKRKVQVLGLQELFYGPYFCAEQQERWYELTEPVPEGPTVTRMQKLAKKFHMVMIVPVYEIQMAGVFFNTAAVIDADGRYLGKYRKHHIPHCHPGFWEKFYFTPGNGGYPVFQTRYGRIGVYICYDRHFPEGAFHGDAVVHRADQRAQITAHAFLFDDSRHVHAHAVQILFLLAGLPLYGSMHWCAPSSQAI
jgi:beta-ureidopropionase